MATQKQIGEHLNLTPKRVSELTTAGTFSSNNIDTCRIEYISYLRKLGGYNKKSGTSDIAEEKTRLTKAQADKAELEVSELEAELIPADLVQTTWIDYITNVRAKLLGLPSRIAHQVITVDKYAEAEIIIKEKVYEALDELVNEGIPAKYRKSITESEPDVEKSIQSENI